MSVLTCASSSSWRGLEYYKQNKALQIKKISDIEFKGVVSGAKQRHVMIMKDWINTTDDLLKFTINEYQLVENVLYKLSFKSLLYMTFN